MSTNVVKWIRYNLNAIFNHLDLCWQIIQTKYLEGFEGYWQCHVQCVIIENNRITYYDLITWIAISRNHGGSMASNIRVTRSPLLFEISRSNQARNSQVIQALQLMNSLRHVFYINDNIDATKKKLTQYYHERRLIM